MSSSKSSESGTPSPSESVITGVVETDAVLFVVLGSAIPLVVLIVAVLVKLPVAFTIAVMVKVAFAWSLRFPIVQTSVPGT